MNGLLLPEVQNVLERLHALADARDEGIIQQVPPHVAKELREKRDFHNSRLREFCEGQGIPLADICSRLKDEHFADELHPNEQGAKIIAEEVFKVLSAVHNSEESSR